MVTQNKKIICAFCDKETRIENGWRLMFRNQKEDILNPSLDLCWDCFNKDFSMDLLEEIPRKHVDILKETLKLWKK